MKITRKWITYRKTTFDIFRQSIDYQADMDTKRGRIQTVHSLRILGVLIAW
ncbi:Uncharacterised protein [Mycobacteroides abscessus subsp. bolletii]|nr:Uncharacterised protein [Mycobacteroides abscessus subsp. bolletii]SKS05299.1 Uncharacterised protein [Mycobacteroides abscessus subsp. abscessus]SHW63146.1 Uncharacterised protein [Mycobacteroides abscessus subsp. bolletii]SHW91191.1 Uncharacterised protein [Mycobacteroides abscessus subsp. bolletii]SHX34058.1 Uncharacterised protein [Mycobacteroides abscessus subsp. bolletii]